MSILNPKLYAQSKRRVNKIYGTTTSAYRSMAIVKDYKRHGGTYASSRASVSGLSKWLREKWIVVSEFLRGKTVACGTTKRRKHACRPSVRVDHTTPITVQETVRIHGKRAVAKLAAQKAKGSEYSRVDWKSGKTSERKKK